MVGVKDISGDTLLCLQTFFFFKYTHVECSCILEHLKGPGVKLESLLLQDIVENTEHCFFIFVFITLIFCKTYQQV